MPDDGVVGARVEEGSTGRSDRLPLLAFVDDAESEAVLRESLVETVPGGLVVRRGNIRAAIAALQKMATPQVLIIDVSGEEQPLTSLADLSNVVEPDVRVLVIGDREDVNSYRQITRGLGALEYLYKPLSRDMVARYFAPLILRQATPQDAMHGGRVVTITGVRGGVGATTIAAHLAWHFGVTARRHTVLLDPDLHRGSAAMLLDAKTGPGLRMALEAPQRVDDLFVERSAQPVSGRLHVLSGEEKLSEQPLYAADAGPKLIDALRRRYNFVVADVPFMPMQLNRDLLELAHQRVLIMPPTLAGVREALRLLALPNGPAQPRRPVVVLNRAGLPGGLTRAQVEDAMKMRLDTVIPDVPRQLGTASTLGQPEIALRGSFLAGISQLAREVAYVRTDGAQGETKRAPTKSRLGRGLFGLTR